MVYCGKPSKGCSNCRERKIRCDQREPGCGQCQKRKQQCPGYRNLMDLMFRDESSHVIKKATKSAGHQKDPSSTTTTISPSPHHITGVPKVAAAKSAASHDSIDSAPLPKTRRPSSKFKAKSKPRLVVEPAVSRPLALLTPNGVPNTADAVYPWASPGQHNVFDGDVEGGRYYYDEDDDDSLLPSPEEGTWPTTPGTACLYTLSPSFQERGTAYFFSRYVTVDENACHQNYDFVYDIWRPLTKLPERQVDGVMASMTAVGLAGLSSLTRCTAMMDWARRSYGTALRLTNDALLNPEEAAKDTTMLSILILGTYEMLTGRTHQTMRAWQEHVNGAAALAKLRGPSQFRSKAGVRMFMMLAQTVMISCIQHDMPMPPTLVGLRDELEEQIGTFDPAWRIPKPIYNLLQVRHDIKRGLETNSDVVMEKLRCIDEEFVSLIASFPPSWRYRVVRISQPNVAIFGDSCQVFPGLRHATTWNGLRSVRMLVHETIISELLKATRGRYRDSFWLDPYRTQLTRSVALLGKLRDAIVASVPQHFGIVSWRDTYTGESEPPLPTVVAKKPPSHVVRSPASAPPSTPSSPDSASEPNGPTLPDPKPTDGSDDGAEQFMTLASASNTIVWPLYLLGVSSSCTQELKEYVTGRLHAVYEETGLIQALTVAGMVQAKEISRPWADWELGSNASFDKEFSNLLI